MYVSRVNFKCDGFAFGRVGHILVSILPILMSFVAISSVFHQSRPCWLSQFYLNRASLEIEQEEECLTCQMKTEKQTEFPRFTEENQTNHSRDRKLWNRTNNDNNDNDFYQSRLVHFQRTQDCSCICKIHLCCYKRHWHHRCDCWLNTRQYLKRKYWTSFYSNYFVIGSHNNCKLIK